MTNQILKSKLIKNYLASTGYYPDADIFQDVYRLKDIVDILDDKVMSILEILERNNLTTFSEFKERMQERIMKNIALLTKIFSILIRK